MSKLHNVNPDGHSAKSAYSSTLRLTVSLTRKSKKSGGKGSVALLMNSKQMGCVFQDLDSPKSKLFFSEGPKIIGTEAQRALLKRYITPRKNSGNKGFIAG